MYKFVKEIKKMFESPTEHSSQRNVNFWSFSYESSPQCCFFLDFFFDLFKLRPNPATNRKGRNDVAKNPHHLQIAKLPPKRWQQFPVKRPFNSI